MIAFQGIYILENACYVFIILSFSACSVYNPISDSHFSFLSVFGEL